MQTIQRWVALIAVPLTVSSCALEATPGLAPQYFAFNDLKGNTFNSETFRGSYLLLHFWATWCVPCVSELPRLQNFADQLAGLPFYSVAIAVDDTADSVALMLPRKKSSLIVLLDPKGQSKRLFELAGLPYTILLDPTGRQIPLPTPINGAIAPALYGAQVWDAPMATEFYRAYFAKVSQTTRKDSGSDLGSAESP